MKNLARRALLLSAGGAAGYALSSKLKPALPVLEGSRKISATAEPLLPTEQVSPTEHPSSKEQLASTTQLASKEQLSLNDASGLSATRIHKHLTIKGSYTTSLVESLRLALKEAQQLNLPLNVGAARHSMGGQAIPTDGIAVTLDNGMVETDSENNIYRVHAGARWSQVIAALDTQGWSPAVTQANHDFGVAATFSVNAHGWPVPFGPMGSTVHAIRMIMPSGDHVQCSRTENPTLFKHAMGGYGLIGIITDLDIRMVRNTRLAPTFKQMPAENFATAFRQTVSDPNVKMAYGRLNVERGDFFNWALLRSYRESADQTDLPAASSSGVISRLSRQIYRSQLGNEAMKSFRWWNETVVGPRLMDREVTRNSLINEPVVTLADRDPDRTDILHEYFISFDRFNDFIEICRDVIPASYQELLNVTLRYIATDTDSTLAYATAPRIAAVMSFSQETTHRADTDMKRMTQEMINRVLEIGGTYYLPYRPHATLPQFARAYPGYNSFITAKKIHDPKLILRNNLWDTYLSRLA